MDENALKAIVGHSILDITESVYTVRDLEWLREDMEKLKQAPNRVPISMLLKYESTCTNNVCFVYISTLFTAFDRFKNLDFSTFLRICQRQLLPGWILKTLKNQPFFLLYIQILDEPVVFSDLLSCLRPSAPILYHSYDKEIWFFHFSH